MELAKPFIALLGLTDVDVIGEGLEFIVFRASWQKDGSSEDLVRVALRIPKSQVFSNVNDPSLDALLLLQQEARIYELLKGGPVPVPNFFAMPSIDSYPAMVSEFVEDDSSIAPSAEMGRVLALIHSTTLPPDWRNIMIVQEGSEGSSVLPPRMARRFVELEKEVPEAGEWIPSEDTLRSVAEGLDRFPSCLLHMDFRDANLRMQGGCIAAVLDWENALIGPAVIDVYRVLELVRPGDGFLEAYTEILPLPRLSHKEEMFLRLDAALMLALVFISEAPDPERRLPAIERVAQLARCL